MQQMSSNKFGFHNERNFLNNTTRAMLLCINVTTYFMILDFAFILAPQKIEICTQFVIKYVIQVP